MNAARRSRRRQGWPRGLDEPRPGYYSWRHPDGYSLAIGRVPLAVAINEALAANQHLAAQKPGLVEKLTGASQSVAELLLKMPTPEKKNTAKSFKSLDKKIGARLGSITCHDLTVRHCAEAIDAEALIGARTAQAVRSRLIAVCRRGQELGWMDSNPAEVTRADKVTVQRGRLTLEAFKAIYAKAAEVAEWLPLAMRLALVTGADRSTIAGLQRSDHADGLLTIARGKTGATVAVPTHLRLDCMGWTLADVLAHRSGVVSRYYVHHVNPAGRAPAGSKVHPDRISHSFTEARRLAGIPDILPSGEGAPTLHECRSLSKRLYLAQGNVDTKALLGHTTEKMSELYADSRGAEVLVVRVG